VLPFRRPVPVVQTAREGVFRERSPFPDSFECEQTHARVEQMVLASVQEIGDAVRRETGGGLAVADVALFRSCDRPDMVQIDDSRWTRYGSSSARR
jgi:hypothetical protein